MSTYFSIPRQLKERLVSLGVEGKGKNERGGILIGRYRGPHIEITNMTLPQKKDLSSLFWFMRRDKNHQREAMSAWLRSDHTKTYVGEWHSHPFGSAVPSSIDRGTWQKIVARSNMPMIFVITTPIEVGFFRGEVENSSSGKRFEVTKVRLEAVLE